MLIFPSAMATILISIFDFVLAVGDLARDLVAPFKLLISLRVHACRSDGYGYGRNLDVKFRIRICPRNSL